MDNGGLLRPAVTIPIKNMTQDDTDILGFSTHRLAHLAECMHSTRFVLDLKKVPETGAETGELVGYVRQATNSETQRREGVVTTPVHMVCMRRNVAVFSVCWRRSKADHFSTSARSRMSTYFCVDTRTMCMLGVVRTDFTTVHQMNWKAEITDCALSPDGSYVALAMNATNFTGALNCAEWYIVVYEVDAWAEVARFSAGDQLLVCPSVDFDPSCGRLSILYYIHCTDRCATISTLDIDRGERSIVERRVDALRDFEYGAVSLTYSKDGALIVVQLTSGLWRSTNSLCLTLVLSAHSLAILCRYESTYVRRCGDNLVTCARPEFNGCGDCLAMRAHDPVLDNDVMYVYRVPTATLLQNLCRNVILRQLYRTARIDGGIDSLPLPRQIKDYLEFRSTSVCS